jgi:hypothetical protein
MAIKTFTTGELLTASDTNTYLANSGLVFIKQQTIGTAVSSVAVTSAFSSTYENYKILVNGGTSNVAQGIGLVLGSTTTGNLYDYVLNYWTYAGVNTVAATAVGNSFAFAGEASTTTVLIDADLYFPQKEQNTFIFTKYLGSVAGSFQGRLRNTTQYTDFTISVAGTLTGGTITVYGYRKG